MKEILDFMMNNNGECEEECTCLNKLPIAYSYTPMQELDSLYECSDALKNGTVFPELNLPFGVYGNNFCKMEGMING